MNPKRVDGPPGKNRGNKENAKTRGLSAGLWDFIRGLLAI